MRYFLTLLAFLIVTTELRAQTTLYVTDEFRAPLHSGPGPSPEAINPYKIRANIPSGTPLRLLETDSQKGYSKVVTARGTEGWMLSRYLIQQPIARDRLADFRRQVEEMGEDKEQWLQSQMQLQQAVQGLEQDNTKLTEINAKLVEELDYVKEVSGNTLQINQRNQGLIEETQKLQTDLDLLQAENRRLEDDSNQDFFMLGAGAVILGLIFGLVLPSLRPKRKDPGWV